MKTYSYVFFWELYHFITLISLDGPIWVKLCVWCEVKVLISFFACDYLGILAPSVERIFLPWIVLGLLSKWINDKCVTLFLDSQFYFSAEFIYQSIDQSFYHESIIYPFVSTTLAQLL